MTEPTEGPEQTQAPDPDGVGRLIASGQAAKLGDLVYCPEGTRVTRPDGTVYSTSGDAYVLDVPGTFEFDDSEVTVE